MSNQIHSLIANQLGISLKQIEKTLNLFDEGCTIPFIARYRKEITSNLDEVAIENIKNANDKLQELVQRKATIIKAITEQDKLTPELQNTINNCWNAQQLEDIYLPYKQKRKTRASIAKEKGLEPLALWLLREPNFPIEVEAKKYLNKLVQTIDEAIAGARDIVAETINEDLKTREIVRNNFNRFAILEVKVAKGKETEGQKYADYFSYSGSLNKCPSHRLLAIFRGENEGFLKINIAPDEEILLQKLQYNWVKKNTEASAELLVALKDSYKRLLAPSIENETKANAKTLADDVAITVFAENLRQLLLSSPLPNKRILGIDPGYRTGCKVVCIDTNGDLLTDTVIYPFEGASAIEKAKKTILDLVQQNKIEVIAIGNGTAGRETETFIKGLKLSLDIFMVNEDGASIYSASEIGREEMPDKDITVRGAVSIARRLADPLAELVKIDPKSIGVGQYQHDVDQNKLKASLDSVIESCVNKVGVNLNSASKSLLTHVSGLNKQTAQNVVDYRQKIGLFKSRNEIKKVPRLGDKAFEQCAAFLRIPNAKNPLDNSAVHPESYAVVENMAKSLSVSVADLVQNKTLQKNINITNFVTPTCGLETLKDIVKELAKPGLDPREPLQAFSFGNVSKMEDLNVGMVLPGIVTNITNFGCFVDIGVKQDGLVHISQISNSFVSDPKTVVKLTQQVMVKVTEVDIARKRIALSMKLDV